MQIKILWLLPLLSIYLTACGGSGSGSSKPQSSASSSSQQTTSASSNSLSPSSMSSAVSSSVASSTATVSSISSSLQKSSSSSSSSTTGNTWTDLDVISGAGAGGAQAVLDAAGNALVVWKQLDENQSTQSLWFRRYSGSTWTEAQLIEQAAGSVDNFILINDQQTGRAMIIWKQLTSTQFDLWVSAFEAGSGWSTPVNIESNNGSLGDYDLVMDSQKNAIAVWAQIETAGRFSIYANRFNFSSGWGTAVLIENINQIGRQDGSPKIAKLLGGDAEVVWMKSGTSPRGIWHNKFSQSSGWGEAAELVTDNSTDFTFDFPRIASSGNGIAYLFWGQADLTSSVWHSGIQLKTYAGGWGQANTPLEPRVQSDAVFKPYVKLSSTNKALVVRGGDGQSILANSFANGELSNAIRIKPIDNLDVYSEPVVAVDTAGNGFVTWTQKASDLIQTHLYLVPYSATSGWKPAIVIGNLNEPAYDSYVAMNEQGKAILVWTKLTGNQGTKIYARYYQP
jgi:hypothetical protein